MPKYGLPTRKNRPLYPLKSGPSIPSGAGLRYFRRNEGSTDYISIPEITLSADFYLSVDVLPYTDRYHILSSTSAPCRIYYEFNAIKIQIGATSSVFNIDIPIGVISNITMSRTGSDLTVYVNSVKATQSVSDADGEVFTINTLMGKWGGATSVPVMDGITANLNIIDNSVPVRDYPINDNDSIIRDTVNGQDGSVINGNADDWGLFDKQTNGDWLRYSVNYDWTDPSQLAGWNLIGNTAEVVGEKLRLTSTTGDPQIERGFNLIGKTNTSVKIVSRSVSGTNELNQIFWKTTTSPSYSVDKSLAFGEIIQSNTTVVKVGPDSFGYFTYNIDMSAVASWIDDTVTGIRFDFTNGEIGTVTDIDLIRVVEVLKNA